MTTRYSSTGWRPQSMGLLAVLLAAGWMLAAPAAAQANSGWGSWGSSGGYGCSGGSSGGSWGSSGGYQGRRPVRNLLGRIGYRVTHLGQRLHYGSSGGHWGSSGGWGCSGGHYASSGGSSGGTWAYGSSGSMLTTRYYLDRPLAYTQPVYTGSHYQLDCTPVPGTLTGGDAPGVTDGGSINSMLEPGSSPAEYYAPQNTAPADGARPAPAEAVPGGQPMPNPGPATENDVTQREVDADSSAVLSLEVPEEAQVFINGRLTNTPGRLRRYRSRNLSADQDYHYQIRAELERDGQRLVRTELVSMRGGTTKDVRLDFDATPITTLALDVPVDAKVTLCGRPTEQTGHQRQFTTEQLADGQTCRDYQIEVTYLVDGREVQDVRSIELTAGDRVSLEFGPNVESAERVAAR